MNRFSEETRTTLRRGLHLGVLWAFVVGQPLLSKASSSVFFFLPRSAAPFDFVIAGLVVFLVAPLVLLAIEAAIERFSGRAAEGFHLLVMGALFSLLAMQLEHFIGLRAPVPGILLGLAVGAGVTFAYAKRDFLPTVLDVLSPAPLLFLLLFLFFSQISPLVLPGGEPEAADVEPETTPPVVLVVMDEFPSLSLQDRPGHIDQSLFPNFARLADRSTWYPNATSVADSTEAAVPAVLTGSRPDDDPGELAISDTFPHSIFTLLGDFYDIDAVETETQICPRSLCDRPVRDPFFPRVPRILGDLAKLAPAAVLTKHIHRKLYGGGAGVSPLPPKSPQELFDLFEDQISSEPAHMSFLHSSNLPHKPWNLVPSKRRYATPAIDAALSQSRALTASEDARINERKRHLLQAGAADSLLGDTIDTLEEKGIWDEALVVVVADHGISFRTLLPRRKAVPNNLDQVGLVPFFVKAPGQTTGGVDPAPAETIDVLPTIAKIIGVPVPWEIDGVPADEAQTTDVEMTDFKRRHITSPRATVEAQALAFQKEWAGLLHYGDGWDALIRSGPGSKLIGEPVPPGIQQSAAKASIPQIPPPDGDHVLAVVDGTLTATVPPGAQLGVAVNGRVEAVTSAIKTEQGLRYQAILPPSVYEQPIDVIQILQMPAGETPLLLGERRSP